MISRKMKNELKSTDYEKPAIQCIAIEAETLLLESSGSFPPPAGSDITTAGDYTVEDIDL